MLSNSRINNDKLVLEFISSESHISIRRLVEIPVADILSISRLSTYGSIKDYKLFLSNLAIGIRDHTCVDRDGCFIFELHNPSRALILELKNPNHPAVIFEVSNPEEFIHILNAKLNRQKKKSA